MDGAADGDELATGEISATLGRRQPCPIRRTTTLYRQIWQYLPFPEGVVLRLSNAAVLDSFMPSCPRRSSSPPSAIRASPSDKCHRNRAFSASFPPRPSDQIA